MTWRNELRGVRKPDLVAAVLLVPTLALSVYVFAKDAGETRETQETQVQETQVPEDAYRKAYDYCGARFPYRTDQQDACRWGAYKMLPEAVDKEMQDA